MKKLLASGCCVLLFQSFSHVSAGGDALDQSNGRRVLVRAIAMIVNTDNARKVPQKRIHIPNVESPRD
jgi:hypothetical protein